MLNYRPALLISLVFHGLLLGLPMADPSVPSSKATPQPEATIALADLLASPQPSVRLPASPPQPPATPKPVAASPDGAQPMPEPRAIAPPVSPQPSTPVALSPDPEPVPSASPGAIASPTSTPTPTPQAEGSPDVQTFFEQLATATGAPVNPPAPALFPDPSLYFEPGEPEPALKPDILRAVWMDGRTPQQVYISVLSSQLQSGNFQTEQKPDYGGGTVYEIRQGEIVWYLNLVPTTDGNGTIIVVWHRDPSRPASTQPSPEQS